MARGKSYRTLREFRVHTRGVRRYARLTPIGGFSCLGFELSYALAPLTSWSNFSISLFSSGSEGEEGRDRERDRLVLDVYPYKSAIELEIISRCRDTRRDEATTKCHVAYIGEGRRRARVYQRGHGYRRRNSRDDRRASNERLAL